jgi:hypothetical protein
VRQVAGVLEGDETLLTILGLPLVYVVWVLAGFVTAVRKVSALLLFLVLPFLIVFPYFSGHYGMVYPVRFTGLLTPVFAAGMGLLLATAVGRVKSGERSWARWAAIAGAALAVLLIATQPVALLAYYESIETQNLSGRVLLTLCREMVELSQGERVYVSNTGTMMRVAGIPYVPHSHLLLADIHQEFLAPSQIIGRLLEAPGPAMLLLDDESAALVGQVAPLAPWPSTANAEAQQLGYGLYTLDAGAALVKPDHVLTGESALAVEPRVVVGAVLGGGTELIGYDMPESAMPGETLLLTVYWRVTASLPQGTYVGFVHLFDPAAALSVQDDHLLGGESYPLGAWRADEVVVETYALEVPEEAVLGHYTLRAGVYTWPDLDRLGVLGHDDDIVELGTVEIVARP